MRLRLAVVAVVLLVSFGVRAKEFGFGRVAYIGNLAQSAFEPISLITCYNNETKHEEVCKYSLAYNMEIVISENIVHNRMNAVSIVCNSEPCILIEAIKILMQSSQTLTKYANGPSDAATWEDLLRAGKANRLLKLEGAELQVIVKYQNLPSVSILMAE